MEYVIKILDFIVMAAFELLILAGLIYALTFAVVKFKAFYKSIRGSEE